MPDFADSNPPDVGMIYPPDDGTGDNRASGAGVAQTFEGALSNAINMLGTVGVNAAARDLGGNGYATPVYQNGVKTGAGQKSAGTSGSSLLVILLLAFFAFKVM